MYMYNNENELYNLKVEELKVILKENRKYKNKNSIRRKYYWKVWNILNEKYKNYYLDINKNFEDIVFYKSDDNGKWIEKNFMR